MSIEQQPFVRYHEEKKDDSFSVKLSKDGSERELLKKCKSIIEQTKDSTALKSLAWIGAKVLLEPKTSFILETIIKNKKKNKRVGIPDFD